MREKLETLSLIQLRELARSQQIKVSGLKKSELIDRLCQVAEQDEKNKETGAGAVAEAPAPYQAAPEAQARAPKEQTEGNPEEYRADTAETGENPASQARPSSGEAAPAPQTRSYSPDGGSQSRSYSSDGGYQRRSQTSSYGYQSRTQSYGRSGTYQSRGYSSPYSGSSQSRSYSTGSGYDAQSRPSQGMNQPQAAAPQPAASQTYQSQNASVTDPKSDLQELDSGIEANGILEVMPDGFGFIRCENFLPGENDVYVAPSQIRRFNLKTGDIIRGSRRIKTATEKFAALLYVTTINGYPTSVAEHRPNFEDLTPIFPDRRLNLEVRGEKNPVAMRVMNLLAPIGKGQRGMIVSPPKAGKTTLLKQVAKAVTTNYPDIHLIILLIDERPEEVTDMKESVLGPNVEVIYSTFDELPERHKRVSEMVIERAKRLVEHGRDVMILLDSITRLARAYNLVVPPSGRTLSGGLDPAALHMPKRFFGAARNMREGGSLTILATALVNTGSRMDDVVYEEFKGTGNMELVLDRKLSERRIFPAIDILQSGTRRDDLLLTKEEAETVDIIRKATNAMKPDETVEKILDLFSKTRTNREFLEMAKKIRL